jgi:hypothetical protein
MDLLTRVAAPYDLSPTGFHAVKPNLEERIDFAVPSRAPITRFITATTVRTGRGRVFCGRAVCLRLPSTRHGTGWISCIDLTTGSLESSSTPQVRNA